MNLRYTLIILFLCILLSSSAAGQNFDVRKFGAKGDGASLDTKAIQSAVDQCEANGGGQVYFPAGKYLSGTIFLKDNVVLCLEAGSELLGSTMLEDYPVRNPALISYVSENYNDKSLIYGENVNNVGIIGKGTINGQGENSAFHLTKIQTRENYRQRPFVIRMIECKNVTIRDITLKNSPMWMQHYQACENLNIDGITVVNKVHFNNDGMDIDDCRFVRISNCNISSIDDVIVLKSTTGRLCEHIVITNCILSSDCNAFKLGTESTGGFRDILVANCSIYDTNCSGIALETVDGGIMERVVVSGITMVNAKNAIFIRLGNRARPFNSLEVGLLGGVDFVAKPANRPKVGALKDVMIRNVIATGIDSIGCSITGLSDQKLDNISLSDISLSFKGGGRKELSTRQIEEKIRDYPEYHIFGALPAYGFFIRHAKNVIFSNIHLKYENPEFRPAIYAEDVDGLSLQSMFLKTPFDGSDPIILKQVSLLKTDERP